MASNNFGEKLKEGDSSKDTYPYLDNVTMRGRNQQEHDDNVKRLLHSISKCQMILKQKKTISLVSEINILGCSIGNRVVNPDSERVRLLRGLPTSHNAKPIKRPVGLFAYYAKWVKGFSHKIERGKNTTSFALQSEVIQDSENLKKDNKNASLSAIDEEEPFEVECDASDIPISATLNQNGKPWPLCSELCKLMNCIILPQKRRQGQ